MVASPSPSPLSAAPPAEPRPVLAAAGVALAALAAAGLALWLAAALLPGAPPPSRSPFGVGVSEAGGGLSGWAAAMQAEYGRRLSAAVLGLRGEGGWAWLAGLSFAYGVLHAAGPGHGKAVVSAYILATGADLRRGIAASAGAAAIQGLVAAALVLGLSGLAGAGPDGMRQAAGWVETAGFAGMAGYGAWLLWRKASALVSDGTGGCGPGCGHAHAAPPPRGGLAAAAVGGARPCSGAILVLALALSQGMPWAGAASVAAMSAGTALTTAAAAAASVYAKGLALRAAGGRPGPWTAAGLAAQAVLAAAVAILGLLLATGHAGGVAGAMSG